MPNWPVFGASDDPKVGYVHVGRGGGELPSGIIDAVSIGHNGDGTLSEPEHMLMFATSVGGNHYLNLVHTENEEKDKNRDVAELKRVGWNLKLVKSYCLAKYEIRGDTLSIWIMDGDAQKKLIRSGKVKGTVQRSGLLGTSVEFTDSTENLAAMLAAPDSANLFDKEPTLRFKRVK